MSRKRLPLSASLSIVAFVLLGLSSCGVNKLPTLDEQVKAAWSEVLNQYQRRSDLIPNLVETVKGYAKQEQATLTAVTEARAKATQMTIPADILSNPTAFHQFEQNQAAARWRIGPASGGEREISGAQIESKFSRLAVAARGHREPDRDCAPRLHQCRANLQHGVADNSGPMGRLIAVP